MIPTIRAEAYHSQILNEFTEYYEKSLKTYDCTELIELTMSIYAKKQYVEQQKRKFRAVDEQAGGGIAFWESLPPRSIFQRRAYQIISSVASARKGEATKMNVTNKKVHHRQFGDGVVTGQTISTVTVQFSEEYGVKKFLYPSAFESFLTMDSLDLKEKMDIELREIRERSETVNRQREEEAEQRRDEECRALLKQKQAAKKHALKKKTPPKPKAQPDSAESSREDGGE